MVYSTLQENMLYILQEQVTMTYLGRKMTIFCAEAITYIGQSSDGSYIFLKRDKRSISLPSLINVFDYSVGPDIYVPYPKKEPKFFR